MVYFDQTLGLWEWDENSEREGGFKEKVERCEWYVTITKIWNDEQIIVKTVNE